MAQKENFYSILNDAVNDMAEHGYDSAERLAYWTERLKQAAEAQMGPEFRMEEMLRELLTSTYRQMIDKGQIAQFHQGVGRFTIDQVKPQLHAELERRILASAGLIKLNRKAAVEKTIQRFAGWGTSVPAGGSRAVDRKVEKDGIKKAIKRVPFEERRVLIDQGHKFVASLNNILATDGGAIAGIWRHVGKRSGYEPRPEHLARARRNEIFVMPDNWALKQGLMVRGPLMTSIEKPGEFVFCSCHYEYLYHLSDLPPAFLTKKGAAYLAEVKARIRSMRTN